MVDLPAPDRPVNHSTAGFWPFSAARAALSTSSRCQSIARPFGADVGHHAGADGVAGQPVDQDEAAEVAAGRVGLADHRMGERDRHPADLVQRQFARRFSSSVSMIEPRW